MCAGLLGAPSNAGGLLAGETRQTAQLAQCWLGVDGVAVGDRLVRRQPDALEGSQKDGAHWSLAAVRWLGTEARGG